MTNAKDIKFWNKIARKYAQDPIADEQAYAQTLDRIKSYVKETDTILEIGCGTGTTALILAPSVAHITGTDLSQEMITIAQEKQTSQSIKNATFRTFDAQKPNSTHQYQAVLALNLLHLVQDLSATLAGVHSALDTNGLFISKTVCMPTAKGRIGFWLLTRIIPLARMIGKAPFARIPEIHNLESSISEHGFEFIECGNYPENPPRRFIVARKR